MIVSFDTNILFYALEQPPADRQPVAEEIVAAVVRDRAPLAAQVLREFLAVVHRKGSVPLGHARAFAERIARRVDILDHDVGDLLDASSLAERRMFQFYDALICIVLRRGGVDTLFMEDMQDGQTIDGLRIVNPFNPDNRATVERAIAG